MGFGDNDSNSRVRFSELGHTFFRSVDWCFTMFYSKTEKMSWAKRKITFEQLDSFAQSFLWNCIKKRVAQNVSSRPHLRHTHLTTRCKGPQGIWRPSCLLAWLSFFAASWLMTVPSSPMSAFMPIAHCSTNRFPHFAIHQSPWLLLPLLSGAKASRLSPLQISNYKERN